MKARPQGYSRRTFIVVNPESRLLRMAIEAANLFATMTLRSRIEVYVDVDQALRKAAISRPDPGAPFP